MMRTFHILKISIPLPGLAEPEEGWHPAFTQELAAKGAYHEVARDGRLVRLPAGEAGEGSPEEAPAAVVFTGDLRFDAGFPGGRGGAFAARLDEGRVLWAERLDYARFEGRARLYYRGGRPIAMTDDEYRERRRADHEREDLTEDHVVSALSPRAASYGGAVGVETRSGARFEVVPEGELALPKPGDEVRLYLSPGRTDGAPGEVVGVDLNGGPVYYEPPEEQARRSAPPVDDRAEIERRAMRQWSQIGSPGGLSPRGFAATAAYEVTVDRRSRQAVASRLLGHVLNFSHSDPSASPATGLASDAATGDAEGRQVDPWTGRPHEEGGPGTG